MANPAVFQVAFPGAGSAAPFQEDLLELWQPFVADESSFGGGEQPGIVWRADLPEDPLETARLLNIHALDLRRTGLALSAAGPLLVQDLRHAAAQAAAGQSAEDRPSYALTTAAASDRHALLAQALNYQAESVSFSLKDELVEAAELIGRFAGSLQRLVDQFALVESGRGGRRAARTRLDWLGDVHTWCIPGVPAPVLADHRRVLAQALATRQAWLRLATVLTAGAAKVGLAMTAGGPFNPVAIWTAWQYVQKVLAQYRTLRPALPDGIETQVIG